MALCGSATSGDERVRREEGGGRRGENTCQAERVTVYRISIHTAQYLRVSVRVRYFFPPAPLIEWELS